MAFLTTYIMILISFTEVLGLVGKELNDLVDDPLRGSAPSNWYITRDMWQARQYNDSVNIDDPLRLVIVQHTVSKECKNFDECATELRNMQSNFLDILDYDIPYNFIIGNDGKVYEGRGWNKVGAHTLGYNSCSLGLAFIGDYREDVSHRSKVTKLQQKRAHMLFEEGIKLGHLHPQFHVLGARDLQATISPGDNLYKAIQRWSNYDHKNQYKNRTCKQIKEQFKN